MGYNTTYEGIFEFPSDMPIKILTHIKKYLGEDCRDHPEWGVTLNNYYVSLDLSESMSGLVWDGSEKTHSMCEIINFIIDETQKVYPEFVLSGYMIAQGKNVDDRYRIVVEDGRAVEIQTPPEGKKIRCPHCEQFFYFKK